MNYKLLQIRLPVEDHFQLRHLALIRGTTAAELVRQALDLAHPEIHAGASPAPGADGSGAHSTKEHP
jgi:hypothetical protein